MAKTCKRAGRRHRRKHMRGGAGASEWAVQQHGTAQAQMSKAMVSGTTVPARPIAPMKGGSRSKKGGFWGEVLKQAVVPFALLGMQQTFRRKGRKSRRTRKH